MIPLFSSAVAWRPFHEYPADITSCTFKSFPRYTTNTYDTSCSSKVGFWHCTSQGIESGRLYITACLPYLLSRTKYRNQRPRMQSGFCAVQCALTWRSSTDLRKCQLESVSKSTTTMRIYMRLGSNWGAESYKAVVALLSGPGSCNMDRSFDFSIS